MPKIGMKFGKNSKTSTSVMNTYKAFMQHYLDNGIQLTDKYQSVIPDLRDMAHKSQIIQIIH